MRRFLFFFILFLIIIYKISDNPRKLKLKKLLKDLWWSLIASLIIYWIILIAMTILKIN
jgi:hydrogenase-4 membrane subunit HyfE